MLAADGDDILLFEQGLFWQEEFSGPSIEQEEVFPFAKLRCDGGGHLQLCSISIRLISILARHLKGREVHCCAKQCETRQVEHHDSLEQTLDGSLGIQLITNAKAKT